MGTLYKELKMAELKEGCVKPARGPIVSTPAPVGAGAGIAPLQEVSSMIARVGKEAIDFEANAFIQSVGIRFKIKLSDYKGKWIDLCFYPGDFTFV